MKKRALSTLLVLCMALTLLPGTVWAAQETTTSGTCGDNVTWDYDVNTETLTISGTGAMYDYDWDWSLNPPPYLIWNTPQYAVSGNNNHFIRSVVVSEGITHIGEAAFGNVVALDELSKLQNIQLPSTLETIGDCAFTNASSLTSISLPSGLRSIGAHAFSSTGLTSLHIPASTTEIGGSQTLIQLNAVTVDSGNPKFIAVDSVLYQKNPSGSWELLIYPCQKTDKTYIMPDQVDMIPEEAFAHSIYLETVALSSNVNAIPCLAFDACTNLTSITLPDGITEIDSSAFWFCDNLSRLDIPSTVQNFSSNRVTFVDGGPEPSGNLSVYFYSYKAPIFDDGVAATRYSRSHNSKVTIYYPQNAVGWDDVQRQEDVRRAVSAGILEFQPWAYEAPAPAPQMYTVSYDLNGGVGAVPDPSEYQEKSTVYISPAVPTREGYTFVGWSDGITTYQAGQNFVMPSRTITLAAQWKQEVVSRPGDSAIAQQFVNTALAQSGKKGSDFGFTEPWCGLFAGWCAAQNNLQNIIAPKGANGVQHYNYVINHGGSGVRFYNNRKDMEKGTYLSDQKSYTPQVGDIVIFTWDDGKHISHVGIVCGVSNKEINVVHGNWAIKNPSIVVAPGDRGTTSWNITDTQIYAYARPNWAAANTSILGTRIDRYQCPINVRYEYNGEILDSATGQLRSSFGTMTLGNDDSITVELNSYCDADITITGAGTGVMDLTSTYYNNSGAVRTKVFQKVPITQNTFIDLYAYDDIDTEYLMLYTGAEKKFVEAWGADTNEITTEPNQELTTWLLDENSSTMPSETIPETTPTVSGNSSSGSSSSGNSGSSSNGYSISVPSSITGGTVKVSPANASAGTRAIITVTPNSGYTLDTLTVTDTTGNQVSLTDQGNNQYTFTMPKSKVFVTATFKAAAPNAPEQSVSPSETASLTFIDVDVSAYYYDAVCWAVERGITSGTSPTTFSPDATCTRAQMVSFLWSAAGSPKVNGNNPFTDVPPGTYYYDAVLWAVEQGVTTGVSDTAFSPNDAVTRSQTVTLLYRAAGSPSTGGGNPFVDVPSDAFFTSAVQWAVNRNVTMGTSDYAFSPYAQCTRAQIVTFLYRDRASGF